MNKYFGRICIPQKTKTSVNSKMPECYQIINLIFFIPLAIFRTYVENKIRVFGFMKS